MPRRLFLAVAVLITLGMLPAQGQEKARFRITVCGWKCIEETTDHALQVDGKGDEVLITTRVQAPGQTDPVVVLWTRTMGDVNDKRNRVQAGSRSDKGGIKTGDQFPGNPFAGPNGIPTGGWKDNDHPDLPFVLWEGELVDGKPGVDVWLSIWEDDEGGAQLWDQVLKVLNSPIVKDNLKQVDVYTSEDGTTRFFVDLSGVGQLLPQIFGRAADRPIGVPKAKSFTFSQARQAARIPAKDGVPEGVITVPFRDSEDPNIANHGQYDVWLRVTEIK